MGKGTHTNHVIKPGQAGGGLPANVDFAEAAARVLERRVQNAPDERREQHWLRGWLRRVDSYRRD